MSSSPKTIRQLSLRPFCQSDIEKILDWRSDPRSLAYWSNRRALVPIEQAKEEFYADLRGDMHVFQMISHSKYGEIGAIYSYDAQFVDQHCWVTTYLEEEHRNRGLGAVATAMFVDYLFTYFSFRKLYFDVYEYNVPSLSSLESFGLKVEGSFPEHRYFNDKWHSLKRLALYRESSEKVRALLRRM